MSEHAKAKHIAFNEMLDGLAVLTTEMEAEDGKGDTPENREKLAAMLADAEKLRKSIEADNQILGLKAFQMEPVSESKVYGRGGDGAFSQPFQGRQVVTPGEAFVETEAYKSTLGKSRPRGTTVQLEVPGIMDPRRGAKATFDAASTGLLTDVNYSAGPVLIEQQRLTIRDLLPVGQTTQSQVNFIKETSFTNAADMVAEEGLKPEATFALEDATAPVRKIAVVGKVTDEMWNDFPMLRDYVNMRLRFMVEAKEEQQLLSGTGVGQQITGILQTSGIQTQALSTNTHETIYKAMTKIRVNGQFEPSGVVVHPNDWEAVRLAKDGQNQYYGGGPFVGPYGNGGIARDFIWGLPVVVTTAITEGTGLVGAFRLGAQIWQREGINVEATNTNEDDFVYNRMTIRVEERLALTVYRPLAFCTITGI